MTDKKFSPGRIPKEYLIAKPIQSGHSKADIFFKSRMNICTIIVLHKADTEKVFLIHISFLNIYLQQARVLIEMRSLFSLPNLQLSLVLTYHTSNLQYLLTIRYLHGTSNPYPPPLLILFLVTLVSKNDQRRVKNKEIHLDIAKGIWPTALSSYITATALKSYSVPGSRVQLYVSPLTGVQIC